MIRQNQMAEHWKCKTIRNNKHFFCLSKPTVKIEQATKVGKTQNWSECHPRLNTKSTLNLHHKNPHTICVISQCSHSPKLTAFHLCCPFLLSFQYIHTGVSLWGAQTGTQHSRCASPELSRRITSFNVKKEKLLAAFATRTCCWFMSSLSARTPKYCSAESLSSWSALRLFWCLRLILPSCRTCYSTSLGFMKFLLVHFSSLFVCSLWRATQLPGISGLSHVYQVLEQSYEFIEECTSLS